MPHDDLADGVGRLSEVDICLLSDVAKLDALRDLQPLVWALQAQVSRLVGAVHESAAAASADGVCVDRGLVEGVPAGR